MDLAWWISIIGVPLVASIFGVDFYIHKNAQVERDKAIAAKNVEITALRVEKDSEIALLHSRVSSIHSDFNDYRVNAAQLFATVATLRDVKQEITSAMGEMKRELSAGLGKIADKLDRIVERNARRDEEA